VGLEDVVDRIVREAEPHALERARASFDATTGTFAPGESWYEERIAAFFDFAIASFDRGAIARSFAAREDVSEGERRAAIAVTRAERSVFRASASASEELVLECLIGGARYRVSREGAASRLREGDVLDGRLVALDGRIVLMPGTVFHPREAHDAIAELLDRVRERGRADGDLPDALLRMRMRFDRFTSIHARHVYRYEAIDRLEILAASWAKPA
jgi:hypothetical protein